MCSFVKYAKNLGLIEKSILNNYTYKKEKNKYSGLY